MRYFFSLWQMRLCRLANCSPCGAEGSFFSAGPVGTSFSAKACVILQALVISAALTSLPFQFPQTLARSSTFAIRLQWVPGHSFFPRNNTADELSRRGVLLLPSAVRYNLSIHTFRWAFLEISKGGRNAKPR